VIGDVKQTTQLKTQELSSPSQPITAHPFRSYNAKRTQAELAVVSPQRQGGRAVIALDTAASRTEISSMRTVLLGGGLENCQV
jgi:hypothetical protein